MCIPGTYGHQFDIEMKDTCSIVTKTMHSCFSSDSFIALLQKHNITELLLCGFLAEYCVKATAMDALQKGYALTLLEDCIGTGDDMQHRKQQMLEELKDKGATIVCFQELTNCWTAG